MKPWTSQAERRLHDYLAQRIVRENLEGEKAAALKADLRRRVYEEAEAETGEELSLIQLERILGKIDSDYQPFGPPRLQQIKNASDKISQPKFWGWFLGVIVPVAVVAFEATASFCGSVFFDPIPTWWHFVLLALVPLLNGWLLTGARGASEKLKGAACGVTVTVSGFYALLFFPLLPLSMIAVLMVGMGLLSLSPIFAWFASYRLGSSLRNKSISPAAFRTGWWLGAAAVVLSLILLEGPAIWTRANVSMAAGDEGNPAAIERMRFFHSERTLLQACYESAGRRGDIGGTDIAGWIGSGWRIPGSMFGLRNSRPPDSEKAREVFFRVTGKSFTSMKPPVSGSSLLGRGDRLENWEFDDHLGGDQVAVRLKNLDLRESRFDGHVDSVSRIGYGEWTMIFENRSPFQQQEARCLVKLPPGGRVSRLTLWVNGEPREAAFSGVAQVKAAYKEVAVVQRLDPVLVTMAGPDTMLVQCFPVPPKGQMKIRFGVTAALDGNRWELPRIIERNFGTKEGLEHAVWMQADSGFKLTGLKESHAAVKDGPGQSLSLAVPAIHAMAEGLTLVADGLPNEAETVWCEDPFAKADERFLLREPRSLKIEGSGKIVLVIDGSASLAKSKDWLVNALGEGVIGILADDFARPVTTQELADYTFSGGRDNEPALRNAIRLAKENGGIPVVWVHGPQAIGLSQSESLLQFLERGTNLPVIYSVEAVAGPNRLAEAIYKSGVLKRGPTLIEPGEDFREFVDGLQTGRQETGWTWRRSAESETLPGKKVWDQLARLWAARAAEDPTLMVEEAARPEVAARYQLVTPVSGAVVLETQKQFADHGLKPVDGGAVPKIPGVPEPSTGLLIVLTASAAIFRRQRAASRLKIGAADADPL